MKQRISKRILSLILCLLVVVSNSITALATSEMEFIAASLVADDGTAEFLMEHASDYAIVVADNSLDPNPPQEEKEAAIEETVTEIEAKDEAETGMPIWLTIVIIVVIAAVAVIAIVYGIRFFKKKSEDSYYFDEEDEETVE